MNTRTQNVHSPSMLTYTAPSCCDLSRCSAPLLLYFILIVLAFSNWNHPSNLAFVPHISPTHLPSVFTMCACYPLYSFPFGETVWVDTNTIRYIFTYIRLIFHWVIIKQCSLSTIFITTYQRYKHTEAVFILKPYGTIA